VTWLREQVRCCDSLRLRGDLGYGTLPLPHEARLGVETFVGPVVVWNRDPQRAALVIGGSFGLALPYRLSQNRPLYLQNPLSESLGHLVPRLDIEALPAAPGSSRAADFAVLFGLDFRYTEWATALP